jgi:hypothetical protein
VPCGDLVCLKYFGGFGDQFGQPEPLVDVRDAAACLCGDGGHIVTRLGGFEQRLVRHCFLIWVNVFPNGVLDQLVFENLSVGEINNSHGNGIDFGQSSGPEASRSGHNLEAVQIQFADDQRN